jgi:hypothetical protein
MTQNGICPMFKGEHLLKAAELEMKRYFRFASFCVKQGIYLSNSNLERFDSFVEFEGAESLAFVNRYRLAYQLLRFRDMETR